MDARRFRLLAVALPVAAFLAVFGVTLAASGDDGRAAKRAASHVPARGQQLVVSLGAGSGERSLAAVGLDGAGLRPITEPPEGGSAVDTSPSVSPDGRTIAFTREIPGEPPHVYLVRLDGAGLRRLSDAPEAEISPAFSPDGTRIAFSRVVGDRSELFVAEADGSNERRLTETPRADEDLPSWSPNGRQIAFTRTVGGDEDLWVVDADGANPHPLARGRHADSSPAWAPDGARIALVRDGRIALFTFERFEVEYLTPPGSADESGPAWSPDGTRLLFIREPGTVVVLDQRASTTTDIPLESPAAGAAWVPAP